MKNKLLEEHLKGIDSDAAMMPYDLLQLALSTDSLSFEDFSVLAVMPPTVMTEDGPFEDADGETLEQGLTYSDYRHQLYRLVACSADVQSLRSFLKRHGSLFGVYRKRMINAEDSQLRDFLQEQAMFAYPSEHLNDDDPVFN